ncbi:MULTISPECIES: MerR family transcriptional regulator [Cytobacillus]|uniref:MerR family transcriptional regulator n=1 Tax=Cytobacillus stercorigallinarum TaxID=2762240 RepID=A0ABR8QPV8_9BACI|nr:MerR family transcriptional regulator [Cytobacillus stercorigallinarum]MBD7937575.1 MerR family transcriptional regulator [Cytobacillus stercorigallinarum]
MKKERYYVSDISNISGLTKRTIQYYDNEGILKPAGRDEHNRRYYTTKELSILEQITFYRNLGFSLKQIKEEINYNDQKEALLNILTKQETHLYSQLEEIQGRVDAVSTSKRLIAEGYTPPWELLSKIMKGLNKVDMSIWSTYPFSETQLTIFESIFDSQQQVFQFYHTFRKLAIKAASYKGAGVPVNSKLAIELAKEWLKMIEKVTKGKPEILNSFLQVDANRERWNKGEKDLLEEAEPYLEELLKSYMKNTPLDKNI